MATDIIFHVIKGVSPSSFSFLMYLNIFRCIYVWFVKQSWKGVSDIPRYFLADVFVVDTIALHAILVDIVIKRAVGPISI